MAAVKPLTTLLGVLPLLGGCSLLFDASPSVETDADVLAPDAAASDGMILTDANPNSPDASLDASLDAAPPIANCGPGLAGTIALYSVDDDASSSTMSDSVGGTSDGTYLTLVDNGGPALVPWTASRATSRPACGLALDVRAGENLGHISNSALPAVRSLDFWFFIPGNTLAGRQGLLTKDQADRHNGDFAVFLYDQRVVLRTQHGSAPGAESHLCSSTLGMGWHHVAVSFETTKTLLFVDGNPATFTMTLGTPFDEGTSCTTTTSAGISTTLSAVGSPGWFWGMSNHRAPTFLATDPFMSLLDELRFRDQVFTQADAAQVFNSQ